MLNLSPDVDTLVAYEQGELDDEQIIEFFQQGIDAGWVWQFQGHYGRTAANLIEEGLCTA